MLRGVSAQVRSQESGERIGVSAFAKHRQLVENLLVIIAVPKSSLTSPDAIRQHADPPTRFPSRRRSFHSGTPELLQLLNFSENSESAERGFLFQSSRALARGVLLTS